MAAAREEIEAGRPATAAADTDDAAWQSARARMRPHMFREIARRRPAAPGAAAEAWRESARARRSPHGQLSALRGAGSRRRPVRRGAGSSSNGPCKIPATMRPPCPSSSDPSTGCKVVSTRPVSSIEARWQYLNDRGEGAFREGRRAGTSAYRAGSQSPPDRDRPSGARRSRPVGTRR